MPLIVGQYSNSSREGAVCFIAVYVLPIKLVKPGLICAVIMSWFLALFSTEDFYPSKSHGPDSGIGSESGDKRLSAAEVCTDPDADARSVVGRVPALVPLVCV